MSPPCKLCEKRRPRRYCPGVGGDICPVCCGTERENTIDCPADCQYLREARLHDKPVPFDREAVPNLDIKLTEQFLTEHEPMIIWLSISLSKAMASGKAVDLDAREALASLIQTYRTLQSGLIYESRSPNPYAAGIQDALKQAVEEMRKKLAEESGVQSVRDAEILGVLVFLQRLELDHNNGRRRGRAFFDFLQGYFPPESANSIQT